MSDLTKDPPDLRLVPDEDPTVEVAVDEEPNAPARGGQSPGAYAPVSRQESLKRRADLSKLLFSFHPISEVYAVMRQTHGMTDRAIEELEAEICREWEKEDKRRRPFLKSIRIRQLERAVASAAKDGAWPSVIKGSEQLAKMEGTLAPLAVDVRASGEVHHTHAMARLLSDMPADEVRALIEAERLRLTDGGAGEDAIDVEVVPDDGPDRPE